MSFPFLGQEFTFTQPDGSQLKVRGWGDQNRAVFESLDGYTVIKDPVTGFYQYADATPEGDELRPTGIPANSASPLRANLRANLRPNQEAARTLADIATGLPTPRWQERRQQLKSALALATVSDHNVLPAPPQRQTVGDYLGLCLLIDFPDVPATITWDQVEAFCNKQGYSEFGNNGSVFDYYLDNSAGKLRYKTIVTPYYTAQNNRSYYTDPTIPYGQRARDLIKEALAFHQNQGFDFSGLTVDNQDNVYATSVFYADKVVNGWAEGLWPHASRLMSGYTVAPGKQILDYQITAMGSELTLGTYCHENGHMLCDFPDLYNYANQQMGNGPYCLMCLGGNVAPKNPTQVCAYLKYRAGWADSATIMIPGQNKTIKAGENQFYIYAKSATEYFILENREKNGRDSGLTDSGLAIWHIDELGSNSRPETSPIGHQRFECTLVQADGRNDLELGVNLGDTTDLFHQGLNARFGAATTPRSVWFDGTPSGLEIVDISPAGKQMIFSVS